LNTQFLATLCAVAETGSMAAAARRLQISSASVGEQMQSLEKALNARLIARQGRSMVLTESGHAVLDAARSILAQVAELQDLARLGRVRGMLRVGSISTALISVVPPALQTMARDYPEIELKAVPGTSAYLYNMLDNGEIDCALTVQPRFPIPKGMLWHPIRAEPLVLVTPADMADGSVHDVLTRAPFIRMDRKAWSGQIISAFLQEQRLEVKELFEMDAQEAIVVLVARGLGVTLLPDWGITSPSGRAIRKRLIGDRSYDRRLGLIGTRGAREGLIAVFAKALRQAADDAETELRVRVSADQ